MKSNIRFLKGTPALRTIIVLWTSSCSSLCCCVTLLIRICLGRNILVLITKGFQKKMSFQVKYLIYLKRNISRGASSKKLFNMCFTAFPNSFYGPGACPHLWKKCNVSASICLLFQWDVLKRFRKEHSHTLGHFFQLVIEGNQSSAVQRGPSNGQKLTFSRRCSWPR